MALGKNGDTPTKKSKLRVRKNEEANVSELKKQGYQLIKERGGRQVWEKTSSSSGTTEKPAQKRFAGVPSKTGSATKSFVVTPDAAAGDGGYSSKSRDRVALKTRKTKESSGSSFAEKVFGPREDWFMMSGKGKEQRQIDRQNRKNCSVGQGCYVGGNTYGKRKFNK
jgi:hypothetical protein